MPDGTPSFMDFEYSRNHRFLKAEYASRNRLTFPAKQLHWFNAPASMDEQKIKKVS